jgi:predicted metal-dependent enzyme (double-stranded beta helix superfamily)
MPIAPAAADSPNRGGNMRRTFEIDQLVADCRAALKDSSPQIAIKAIVEQAVSQPGDVVRGLGEPQRAELVTLHRSPDLTVLNLIWGPGMYLYPHDHRMWAVIGLYGGREDNLFYRRTEQGLVKAGGRDLQRSDTVLLGETVIHSVENPLGSFTGAIHVYGGDFFGVPRSEWDPATLQERPYDVENVKRIFRESNEGKRPEPEEPPTGV